MIRTPLLSSCMLFGTALALPAQWVEVGDAGQLPSQAQVPVGGGMLFSISGTLGADADMYLIRIDDPTLFDATLVGGATFDTQLFLFRTDGQGVTSDDDDPMTFVLQSHITGVFVPSPGLYYLALSTYNLDPAGQGKTIWNSSPFAVERAPDGPGRLEAIDAWTGPTGVGGPYTIALLGCSFPGQEIGLPDNHHFSEMANQVGSSGSTSWWQTGGGRFQILYERSHFLKAGIGGPIHIEQLLFRADDGEQNLGGQVWNGVMVMLAATTLTSATMSSTFNMNLFPPPPDMTMLGPPGILNHVRVWRSIGSQPNNPNIVVDLRQAGAMFPFDPFGPLPNLLIDITLPTPAAVPPGVGGVVDMQDTTGGTPVVRGAGVYTNVPTAPTGTFSTAPLVVKLNFQGPGGSNVLIPATNEYLGNSCGGFPSTFYQSFLRGEAFDLTGLTLTPDNVAAPNLYTVTAGAPAVDPTQVNPTPNSTADDGTVAYGLGFTFNYPGGSTTQIRPCTNGYVWLNGSTTTADASPTVAELLGQPGTGPARLLPCWYDFHAGRNTAINPNSGLHVLTDVSGGPGNFVCYVTWFDVGVFESVSGTGVAGHAVHDMQLVLHEATGVVEFRYGNMPRYCSNFTISDPSFAAIVGFTQGLIGGVTPSVDPQSRDLSCEVPFRTSPEGPFGNMAQVAAAGPIPGGIAYGGRAFAGQFVTYDVVNVPPTAVIGAQMIDLFASQPGYTLPVFAPGCVASLGAAPAVMQIFPAPGPVVVGTVPLVVPPGFEGLPVATQFVVLDASGLVLTSNALKHRIGLE